MNKSIAIIGAGPSGLVAAKNCLENGFHCTVFEQSGYIGGVWHYTNATDIDEYGTPIHSGMYQNLLTNLPKENMEIPGFKYSQKDRSFLTQPEILSYLESYANAYNLHPTIQLLKKVVNVDVLEDERWSVTVFDTREKRNTTEIFDGVMVCNGHFFEKVWPEIDGQDTFNGRVIHSHSYRFSKPYTNKTILIIGAGPSGLDISHHLSKVAKKIFISHRKDISVNFPDNVEKKPSVAKLLKHEAVFLDGTKEYIDDIIYCTGYKYSYKFLTKRCEISTEENQVYPVYKHIINIEHPTMAFIGLNFQVCPFPLFDLQSRFYLKSLTDPFLPSKREMYEDLMKDLDDRKNRGWTRKQAHMLAETQHLYFEDLASLAKIERLPTVISNIFYYVRRNKYRITSECFEVIDDESFIVKSCKKS